MTKRPSTDGTSASINPGAAPAAIATTRVLDRSWARSAERNRATKRANGPSRSSGTGSKSRLAPSARRALINATACLMKRAWAAVLPRNARRSVSFPESKSWNVGTTRTPLAWAAFVTAAAAGLTYPR